VLRRSGRSDGGSAISSETDLSKAAGRRRARFRPCFEATQIGAGTLGAKMPKLPIGAAMLARMLRTDEDLRTWGIGIAGCGDATGFSNTGTNALATANSIGAAFIMLAACGSRAQISRSSWILVKWVERDQPVQFSTKNHVGDDGSDCRYCNTSVSKQPASAGINSDAVCMNCHKQDLWAGQSDLEPVTIEFPNRKRFE